MLGRIGRDLVIALPAGFALLWLLKQTLSGWGRDKRFSGLLWLPLLVIWITIFVLSDWLRQHIRPF